ncbi:unannotated protein [freshwater metagenome]|uniref:Unannotated protein n=1 Tax=freshwater metagenome TaxID=449393 RepID=A0A6J7HQ64_9ZZZZ
MRRLWTTATGRTALACGLVGILVALAWSVIIPPLQVPDEPLHFAYVQELATTATPAGSLDEQPLSSELSAAMSALGFSRTIGNATGRGPWSGLEAHLLRQTVGEHRSASDGGGRTGVSPQPPAYYLLGAVPYLAADAAGGDVLDRLQAVRALSALLAGLAVFFIFLFIAELLPGRRVAAATGALAVAFQPMVGFLGGGVSADNLMSAAAAALFFGLARAFRRGLSLRLALGIGAAIGGGLVSKLTFVGIVPGAVLGLLILIARLPRGERLRLAAAAAGPAVVPLLVYVGLGATVWDHGLNDPGVAARAGGGVAAGHGPTMSGRIAYWLQSYLPRPWFVDDLIPGRVAAYNIWFKSWVGNFGWLDYRFPSWVTGAAIGVWLVLVALVGRAVVVGRAALSRRRAELLVYAVMVLGLTVVIAKPAYEYRLQTGFAFEQLRYLFPLLALYGAVVALAVRGAGRWGREVAVAIVGLAVAHTIFAAVLTIGRYYA